MGDYIGYRWCGIFSGSLKGDRAGDGARLLLRCHDFFVGGVYRDGETEFGGTLLLH
jgi:hypothetical protein